MENKDHLNNQNSEAGNNPSIKDEDTFDQMGFVIKNANPVGQKFLDFAKTRESPNLMDIGCGNGYPVSIPAIQLGAKLMCIDIMEDMIEQLKAKVEELGIENKNYSTGTTLYPGKDANMEPFGG